MNNHPVYSHGQPEQAAPVTRMPEAPLDFYQELVRPSHSNNNNIDKIIPRTGPRTGLWDPQPLLARVVNNLVYPVVDLDLT